jgi:hypothetical protein
VIPVDVQELKLEKIQLEKEIQEAVNHALVKFTGITKTCPSRIYINLVDATSIGDVSKSYVVGSCEVTIEL